MPLPKPKQDESKSEFITRCLQSENVINEYETRDQMVAVCNSQWSEDKSNIMNVEESKLIKPKNNMKKKEEKKPVSLAKQFELYKSGTGQVPVIQKSVGFSINDGGKKVILSLEEMDRDGETVMIDGIKIPDPEIGIPMIDTHRMNESVTVNGLGAIRNPRIEVIDGKKALVGDPDFAPTPNGTIAKILYMGVDGGKPYFTNVSIGFSVLDYNNETKAIPMSEIFELSLVTVGANRGARFVGKQAKSEQVTDLEKKLKRYDEIHPAFREFTKTFLSDTFCKSINYKKGDNLLTDINNVYDIVVKAINNSKLEAPESRKTVAKLSEQDIERLAYEQILNSLN